MNENDKIKLRNEQSFTPSMENLKASLVFIVLTIASSYISDVLAADMLKDCSSKELFCKIINVASNVLPALFGTIAVFLLELCIVIDLLRLKGALRNIVCLLVLLSLPFVYLFLNSFLQSINLFI